MSQEFALALQGMMQEMKKFRRSSRRYLGLNRFLKGNKFLGNRQQLDEHNFKRAKAAAILNYLEGVQELA